MGFVLINPESGGAESFDSSNYQSALSQGYKVPLNDPDGNPVAADYNDIHGLIANGHSQPSTDQLNDLLTTAQHSTPGAKALTYIEGVAKGIAGPLAPVAENKIFNVPFENIAGREEVNPGTKLAGELTGMGGAMLAPELLPAALPNIISKAGIAAAEGINAEGRFGFLAKKAVDGAVQGALYEASNKVHEGILGDPKEVAEHALADITLSAALGGGLSAAIGLTKPMQQKILDYGFDKAENVIGKAGSASEGSDKNAVLEFLFNWKLAGAKQLSKALIGSFPEQSTNALYHVGLAAHRTIDAIDKHAASIFGLGASKAVEELDSTTKSDFDDLHNDSAYYGLNSDDLINRMAKSTEVISKAAPNTAMSISQASANAINYLNSKRPDSLAKAPLDTMKEPSQFEISKFNNFARVVNNPLSVLNNVKKGTVTMDHIEALKAVYPSVYDQMQRALTGKMIDHLATKNGATIPYHTRLSVGVFLGEPVDSTMMQPGIMANQMALQQNSIQQQQQKMQQMKPSKSGMAKMKSEGNDSTFAQRAEMRTK